MHYIVDTDNFGGDYPDETYVKAVVNAQDPITHTRDVAEAQGYADKVAAQGVADRLNARWGEMSPRYYKVVEEGYVLQPGFEP